ncbi:MAG: hypothetical protein K2X03_29815 [Bryobacteraceae bacterium]|nr:hypothetical protein [Bryobacteraceae bacterium]
MEQISVALAHLVASAIASLAMAGFGDLFGVELLLVAGAWWLARRRQSFGEAFFTRIETVASRFAQRRVAAPVALAAAVILVRAAALPLDPIPHPVVVDEFSHLLLADTLAQGRLANPTHALSPHFEAIHTLARPTYSSMYLPGPALLLYVGQVLTGVPWFGLLFGTGILCGLTCWALQCWFPPRWALLGGALTALHIGLSSYWMNSYWGGTFAALGSTLLLGAFGRLQKQTSTDRWTLLWSVSMALGIGMIANSRPYEGLALCLPVGVRLAGWLIQKRSATKLACCVIPMAIGLAAIGAGMAIYFRAVTGDPSKLPYQANQEQYGWPTTLPWTEVRYVEHDRREFTDYYIYELEERLNFTSWTKFAGMVMLKLQNDWRFFVGPALTIPLFFLARVYRVRRLRFLFLTGAVVLLAAFAESHFPHYLAPALLPIVALTLQGYRHLRLGLGGEPRLGLRLSRAIPVILLATLGLRLAAKPFGGAESSLTGYTSWCCSRAGRVDQPSVERRLPPGKHLLLVRYQNDHDWQNDWTRNRADIDRARVAWARDLGTAAQQQLISYFRDRQVWVVEPDLVPPRLTPFRPAPSTISQARKRKEERVP